MKIGIDIDDVIVNFVDKFLEFYNQKNGTNLSYEDWTTYDFEEIVGLSKEEVKELIYEFHDTGFYDKMELVDGAGEAIKELAKDNEINIITSRSFEFNGVTKDFFIKNFPDVKISVFHSRDDNDVKIDKGDFCKKLGVGLMIEDHVNYALQCAEKGIKVLLLDRPWNQNTGHENITRVSDWNEILNVLK